MKNFTAVLLMLGTAVMLPAQAQPDVDRLRSVPQGRVPTNPAPPAASTAPSVSGTADTALPKVSVRMSPNGKMFDIHNEGTGLIQVDQVVAYYRFPGIDGVERPACTRTQLQPGMSSACELHAERMTCSSLTGIDVEMRVNGQRVQERVPFDSKIREIGHSPRIMLEKPKSDGRADIRVEATGQHVRPGTAVVMRGLVTLNNLQRFPATFRLSQQESFLGEWVHVASPVENQPVDRVCFHLQEITTDDRLMCGGVGALLYRNTDSGQIPVDPTYGNIFVHNQVCK